jgi:phosphoglycerate dehydrogenase-like enzyme
MVEFYPIRIYNDVMKPLKLYVRFLMLNPSQLILLTNLGVTVTKTLDADVNAIFSDQFFIEANINTLPVLDYLQVATSGLDQIPLSHPKLAHAVVSGSRGVFNKPMAEYVLSHVLSVYQNHRFFTQTQKEQQWRPSRHNEELAGKRVAILGMGQIGKQIAKTFSFFGAKVDAFNRSEVDSMYVHQVYRLEEMKANLANYEIVVASLALNEQTKSILSADVLQTLSPKAIFVNVGRSELLDEGALVSLLQEKKIRHAVLDTFSKEPLPKDHPYWALENVTLTPHISFTSVQNLERMFQSLYANLQLYLQNERLINQFK